MDWLDKNKVSLLWAFLWLVCLFLYLPFVSDPGYLPKLAGFSVLIFFGLLMKWSGLSLSKNSALILLALIVFSAVPSLVFSDNLGDGVLVMVRFIMLFLLVVLFSLSQQSDQLHQFAVKASTLSLLFLSTWGLVELVLSLDGFMLTHKATYSVSASLGHRNLYVQYLVLLTPLSAVGLINKGRWRMLSLTAVLMSVLLVVLLLNRTAWFTFGVYAIAVFTSLFAMRQKITAGRKKILGTISFFAVISVIVALFLVDELYTFVHHFETVFDFSKGTSRDRILLAQRSFELFKEHPLFGIGAGMWKIDIMGFTQDGMLTNSANIFYQRPHNDYLWILSESGLVTGLALIALHVVGFLNAVRSWFHNKTLMSLAIVLSWMCFIVASLTSFPIERPEYILFFAMLLVLTFKKYPVKDTRIWRSSLFVFNVIILLVLVIRIGGESDYLKAKIAQSSQSWQESQKLMSTAKGALFQVDALSIPLVHHEALAQFKLGQVDAASVGFKNALEINPYHPETWNNLGICAVSKNYLDSGMICFKNAVRFTTSYQDAWLNIAVMQYNQGKWRTSFRSFLKADSAQNTENYKQLGALLSIDSLTRMLSKVPDYKMTKTLEALRNTPEWAFSVIQKSASNDTPFDRQAYLDACFFMLKHCEEYEDCDLVDEIIDQYLPGGKAELNLTEE